MDRNFVIPVLVAAAIHGGLFLAPRGEVPARVAKPEPTKDYFLLTPPPLKEEVIDVIPDDTAPRGDPEAYRPSTPDTPVLAGLTDITVPITPPMPTSGPIPNSIPLLPPGRADGTAEYRQIPIFTSSSLDSTPRTRVQPPMPYPHEARRSGMTGTVTVEFMVDETGRVYEARALDSSDRIFEAAALAGVSKWRFEPSRRDGKIVRFRMAVPIVFSLNQ